jgi:hypothetical protein
MTTAPGLAPVFARVVFGTADDHDRPLRMVEIENDFEVAWRRRIGRLVHDRDLLLLGPPLERVTQAEHPGRDDGAGRRAAKAVNGSLDRTGFFPLVGHRVGKRVGIVDRFAPFGLVPMEILHIPHRTPDPGIRNRRQEVPIR